MLINKTKEKGKWLEMNDAIFDKIDFGPFQPFLTNDDITDISYCNHGQVWIQISNRWF